MEQVIKNIFTPNEQEAEKAPEQKSEQEVHGHENESEITEEKTEELYPNKEIEQHGSTKESE